MRNAVEAYEAELGEISVVEMAEQADSDRRRAVAVKKRKPHKRSRR
jgi:hypothetical protein